MNALTNLIVSMKCRTLVSIAAGSNLFLIGFVIHSRYAIELILTMTEALPPQ